MAFKTIVATEQTRREFTLLRDELKSSDKELMQAFWNIGNDFLAEIKAEVFRLQEETQKERSAQKELKAAAKKAAKPKKAKKEPKVKKEKALKVPKGKLSKEQEKRLLGAVETVVHSDDGEETLVVVGL